KELLNVSIATIQRMNDWFDHAFQGLAVAAPPAEVHELAVLVYQSMEGKTRTYHTASHVFSLCEGMKPIQILAALFHDVVVYQIDGGLPDWLSPLLDGVTYSESGNLFLREFAPEDRTAALCADIFGFCPGQVLLTRNGMNEFLSAVVAARQLQHYLSDTQLITLVACIELTIPFRAPDAMGHSAAQALARRVQAHCSKWAPSALISESQKAAFVKTTVMDAVDFANRDLAGFTSAAAEYCLSNSMLLVDESMAPKATPEANTLQVYRTALLGMDNFLKQLNPVLIVQNYDGHPDVSAVMKMQVTAKRNITFVRDYLAAVISAVAIIEAVAMSTGTESSISLFLKCNTWSRTDSDSRRNLFPVPKSNSTAQSGVHQLLANGLKLENHEGLRALPLTACVYAFLGREGTRNALQRAKLMFEGTLKPSAFLLDMDRKLIGAVIREMASKETLHQKAIFSLECDLYASSMST
ncbi:MAG: hypothetical protein RJB64_1682, partial [Pseudomonadota bacterium]